MKRFSLKKKLGFFAVTLGVIFSLIISLTLFFYLRNYLIENRLENIKKIAIEQGHQTLGNFEQYKLFIKIFGTQTRILEYLQDQPEDKRIELDKIFNDYVTEDSNILSLYLMDKNGDTLISTDKTFVGQNYGFRNYFKSAMGGVPFVEAALGKTSNKFGYYFSYPVKTVDGVVEGVMVVKVDEKYFAKSISESELRDNNSVMMVDEFGVVMVSSIPERFLHSLGSLSDKDMQKINAENKFLGKEIKSLQYGAAQKIIKNYTGPQSVEVYDQVDGEKETVYIEKIAGLPFFLAVETGLRDLQNLIIKTILVICVAVILSALFAAWLGFLLLSRLFVTPFKKMGEMVEHVYNGDFSYRLNLKTNDEVEDFARAMDLMAGKLDRYYDDLDKQVKEKTEEIEEKNKVLLKQQKAVTNILEDVEKEKKKAENLANDLEKFKLAVDNASDHIVITDVEGTVLYGNKMVEKVTGYTLQESLGKKAGRLWHLPMPKDFYEKFWDTFKNKKQTFVGVLQNRRKSGELYDAAVSISPVLDKNKNILYFVGIERDVTKEKEVDRAKTEFVSLASHQLRTPLSTINWYTEMLLNGDAGKLKPEQTNYLQEIYRGNQRMVELVNSLLNVSRLELGTFIIEPVETDLGQLVDEVIEELKLRLQNKKLSFTKDFEKLPKINLDKKLFRMIIENLMTNAIKYTPEKGKINLLIKKDKDSVEIVVADTGMGIPLLQQDKIFTKLFRADNVRAADTEGTGLGLYLVKTIIEHGGGKIWFESVENKGTTFHVSLPLTGMKKKEGEKEIS